MTTSTTGQFAIGAANTDRIIHIVARDAGYTDGTTPNALGLLTCQTSFSNYRPQAEVYPVRPRNLAPIGFFICGECLGYWDALEQDITAPVAAAAPTSPAVSTTDALVALADKVADGSKFEVSEVTSALTAVAQEWLLGYNGSFDFLNDLKARYAQTGRLSAGQAKGVLNCILADQRRQARSQAQEQAAVAQAPDVEGSTAQAPLEDGYYTVVLSDETHVTLRLKTAKSGGYQNVGFLFGSDNTSDYRTLGGLYPANAPYGPSFKFWRTFGAWGQEPQPINPSHYTRQRHALDVLLNAGVDERANAGREYAVRSGNCYRCGRTLTDPISIEVGIGPTCRGAAA